MSKKLSIFNSFKKLINYNRKIKSTKILYRYNKKSKFLFRLDYTIELR